MSGSGVRELHFSDYYRMLVVEEEDRLYISVDVYKKGFDYPVTKSVCVRDDFCLLYSNQARVDLEPELAGKVIELVIVGSKTPAGLETLNVRWVVKKPFSDEELRKVFDASWRLVKAKPQNSSPESL